MKMVGWIILAVIAGLIILILLIPVGADIRYEDGVIRISAKAAGLRIQIIPRKAGERKEKKKPEKKPKSEKEQKPQDSTGEQKKRKEFPFNAEEILELLRVGISGFGRFGKQFRVERFVFHWICAGMDPYLNARTFSVVNAGLSQLAPLCAQRFRCRDSSVWTEIDFVREGMFFEFGLTATIRIGQIIGTILRIAFGALKILLQSRKRRKREAKEAIPEEKTETENEISKETDESVNALTEKSA